MYKYVNTAVLSEVRVQTGPWYNVVRPLVVLNKSRTQFVFLIIIYTDSFDILSNDRD